MLFRQILHDDLGCASYVVACGGEAIVVDPQWNIEPYLELASSQGLTIRHIVETHNHADHLSGHGRLAAATGARIHVSADAGADFEHEPLRDGDSIRVGDAELRAVATPGHRPEHTSFLLIDHARGDEPVGLLSGDFVFVGDLARPDLAVEPRDGANEIFDSLRRLDDAPAHLEVWPGHVGGSLCGGAGMSRKPSSTLGYERAHDELLALEDREAFVDRLTSGLAPQPPNFRRIAELNRGPLIDEAPNAGPLAPQRVRELIDAGATVIDVRDPREYDSEHVPGSLNVTTASSGVGTRAAWLTPPDSDVVLVAGTDDAARDLLPVLQAAGMLGTVGWLAGGIAAWRDAGFDIATTPAIDVPTLATRLQEPEAATILVDVRELDEWRDGHVDGSVHAPFHVLREGLPARLEELDRAAPIAVACSAGNRSTLAASHLRREGFTRVDHVTDGGVPDLPDHNVHLVEGA